MNILDKFFRFISSVLNGAEKSLLDFLSVFVPYCVPIIPASLTYNHTINQMDFSPFIAWTAAFVVEVLGLTSVATAVRFYRYNLRYTKEANKAPFKLAVLVYIFYITIVLLVNVVLEIVAGQRSGWVILSIALFSLLSFPSSVLVSIRYQFSEMLEERQPKNKMEGFTPEISARSKKEKHASDFKDRIPQMLNEEWEKNKRVLTPKEITSRLKLDHNKNKGFISTETSKWKDGNSDKFTF